MDKIKEGQLLWEPNEQQKKQAALYDYMDWLEDNYQLRFTHYHELWEWSVNELESFWESVWHYLGIHSDKPYETVLTSNSMPGARWFPEATVNYTEHIFKDRNPEKVAIVHTSENRATTEITWRKLYQDTVNLQQTLTSLGVEKGDRVVAYVANIYESIVAFLATASLGAIWSSASPDFGTESVIDRFKQIKPKVLVTVDGYQYGGKSFNRLPIVQKIQDALPTLEATIGIPYLNHQAQFKQLDHVILWQEAIKRQGGTELDYVHVPFNDPLWVLFSSGTTGKPKPIVQSQGGILIEHLKALTFHMNLKEDDRFFWFTTTGWMMWNFLVGGLLTGSTIVLYDGNPTYPHKKILWQLAEEVKITAFGTSASYITAGMKDESFRPKNEFDLSHLKNISSTGSPLPPEGFKWCYDHVKTDLWISSVSGGTDVCTAFILGAPTLPVYAGELQCRGLGAKIESFNQSGLPQIEEIGELVLTEPFPSMPIYFWGDSDGKRMNDSYFDMFPGIWRHGDFLKITERGTCVIYGRSDATINRGGIRIGTSEVYRAIDHINEVADSLIVDIPNKKSDSSVFLFVVMKEGIKLHEDIKQKINNQIKTHCSPRHVPTAIYEVRDLPRTLNGKKLEVPVKRILMGEKVEDVVNKGSLNNAQSLDYFIHLAENQKEE